MGTETKLEYETDDLAFTAYLKAKGETMTRHRAGHGKMLWYFADSETEEGASTKIADRLTEFMNSPEKLFDSYTRDLKKMLRHQLTGG